MMDDAEPLITFLFTDIEGSTRLWEGHPQAMAVALARHDAILRAAIEGHGGTVFKTGGDAFYAAFATATDGVTAALAAQRALVAEAWGATGPLRVRMGLHTGLATIREGDYLGPTLNRVARIMAAGHGGQVLLSLSTQQAVRGALPPGVGLRDLGEQRLKDLIRPERVFQLVSAHLPATFPPLRSLEAFAHNLPLQLTSFVGRDRELAEVQRLLGTTRLLTLIGPGGTGKTRLSLQVAADLIDSCPDGVWLVELAALTNPALVAMGVAAAIGVREDPGVPLLTTLTRSLRGKNLLLLLDNCEHLIAACAELAETLLRTCPAVRILASSREALGIAGETTLRVPSLALPPPGTGALPTQPPGGFLLRYEAVRLFVERAQAVQAAFRLTPANAPAVLQICRRLDGIPLALELAAARVRLLPVEGIAARLDDRFRLLTGGSRTALPRQQTLRALIDWSYDLLGPQERVLLHRLAVFAGGWTLEAAEVVCAGGGLDSYEVLDNLQQLVNKSLVLVEEQDDQVRYHYQETIRQYARERLLETGEIAAVRSRHRDWYVRLAETTAPQLRSTGQATVLRRLRAEHDNLRAALEWCAGDPLGVGSGLRLAGALWRFWLLNDLWSEGRAWLETMLAAPDAPTYPAAHAQALFGLGSLTTDSPTARRYLEESVALWRTLNNPVALAEALDALAEETRIQGLLPAAYSLAEEALALAQTTGDRSAIASALFQVGRTALEQGRPAEARARLEESLGVARSLGDERGVALALYHLGRITLAEDDYATARALFEESLRLNIAIGDSDTTAWLLNSLGEVARYTGDYPQAAVFYDQALVLHEQLGNGYGITATLHNLGCVAAHNGDSAEATRLFRAALRLAGETGRRVAVVWCLIGLGGVAGATGRPARAATLFAAAITLLAAIGTTLDPADQAPYERNRHAAEAALSPAAWAATWAAGATLPLDAAIALAQSDGE
ncbi:MAG: tetratricopeptide repeat protein [Chloroflexota bacterium]|nr:tetratricopeptide repeat protein [Chloroflexota bacterium]